MDDSIAGTWLIVKAELSGEEMPALMTEKIEVELAGGRYVVRFAGEVADHGTYTLDASAETKALLLSGLEGTNAGRTIPAIYRLADDLLHVCYGLDGIAPTAFATTPDQKHYLATYRRR